ncbi:leucine-rich repeats and immunoglobulin-like domains protein 1 [Agrilus planipennis]|uniref:Leucine-rich repeats and immunoglobulin-like domains protein 1 n=1 Tax=Agrilus planipennis TaxID=224129 RepID=A0A1W4WY50_AGRPL|nr:leucine-rich repeats and immunoglobulin-like domains protein 1 [Agrilus planipennis]
MWWLYLSLVWWCGTVAVAAPGISKWVCPEIAEEPVVECNCDVPHTLRCTGDKTALDIIGQKLLSLNSSISVSLLDCTIQNVSTISGPLLEGIALKGLVISSGEIKEIHGMAFGKLAAPLKALGLPSNKLVTVPTHALRFLSGLNRLDLSTNKLRKLESQNFKGLENLSYIDLSNNEILRIAPNTFSHLLHLRVLRLQNNRLTVSALFTLNTLYSIEDLDLSSNYLDGPLDSQTLPNIPFLQNLQLSHNSFSSIKMGALEGLPNLQTLSLHGNQIDVLEDHAFLYLSNLKQLNLSSNRIVAVSGASLDHLKNLIELDLSSNFLRAVAADLLTPLQNLRILRLDDNEISIVSSDAFKMGILLERLTLRENPLNCDCNLMDFAYWLSNSTIPKEDKKSVVCATPPSLENGILIEIPSNELQCGHQEPLLSPLNMPVRAHIHLRSFSFDGSKIVLEWYVEEEAIPYTCDALFVYEEDGSKEVLLESNPLKCNSSNLKDPRLLDVTVPNSFELSLGNRYRFCVVLLESATRSDELSLALGCSDVLPLLPNAPHKRAKPSPTAPTIQTTFTSDGTLTVNVDVNRSENCEVHLALFQTKGALYQKKVMKCRNDRYIFENLDEDVYTLCINLLKPNNNRDFKNDQKTQCVRVTKQQSTQMIQGGSLALIFALGSIGVFLIFAVQKCFQKSRVGRSQCFISSEEERPHHNRYVKLQATTKV